MRFALGLFTFALLTAPGAFAFDAREFNDRFLFGKESISQRPATPPAPPAGNVMNFSKPTAPVTAPPPSKPAEPPCPEDEARKPVDTAAVTSLQQIATQLAPKYMPAGAPACPGYLNADGSPGRKGKTFLNELDKPFYAKTLLSDQAGRGSGMAGVCPNFTRLTREQRKQFWAFLFAALEDAESTCGTDPDTYNPTQGPNGALIGPFQMPMRHDLRDWRGEDTPNRACAAKTDVISTERGNMLCALDIMTDQFRGEYDSRSPGLIGNAYFHMLNTSTKPDAATGKVLRNAAQFAACGSPMLSPRNRLAGTGR